MAKEVTKPPTGLKITRTGNKFTASWKIGDKDYGDSQHFQYLINDTGKDNWLPKKKTEIGHKTTSKLITTIDKKDYYPNVDKKGNNKPFLYTIGFRVKGNRKSYTTGSGKKKKTHKPSTSAWAKKEFTVEIPRIPSVVAELDEELTNVCKFTWSAPYYDDDTHIFTDVQWQTILVKNSAETDGSKLNWKNAEEGSGGAESSKTITEDTEILYKNGDSYVRWFRVRSRGPRGYTEWRYAYHVYALSHQANVTGTSASETDEGGFQCVVDWTVASNRQNPIDKTTAQYTITIPDEGLTCPSGVSWSDANISRDTEEGDAAVFSIDDQLSKDQCLFIRVNTQHDSNITYGKPQLSAVGFLKDPSGLSVSTDNVTHKATIRATNASDVEDSILVVRYVPSSGDPIDIGVIPHNSSSVTVQCPDWDDQEAIAFDVYAMVGTATKQDREDGVDSYSIDAKMRSQNTITQGGAVPVAPKNVSVNRVEGKPDTMRVDWDWPWNEAGSAEISWSDHDDAWESTDEPESFLISNLHASHWNISGLETGKTWYVRVRLIAGNMTDSEDVTYGPWSDISQGTIDLSSAPNKPVLLLSNSVIPEDGSTIASWVYTTTDNTAQAYAEVAIVENNEYIPIAHSLTAQHVTIPAQSENYTLSTGNIYNLVCRVKSASGKLSEWSDIVSLTVAEPLECVISQSSLIEETVAGGGGDVVVDQVPYNLRASGGGKSIGTMLYDKIVGGTVAWNQLAPILNSTNWTSESGVTATYSDGVATISSTVARNGIYFSRNIIANHKYLVTCELKSESAVVVLCGSSRGFNVEIGLSGGEGWKRASDIRYRPADQTSFRLYVYGTTANYNIQAKNFMLIDLTQMFGTTIADYIYSLEQSQAGAGVAWFKKLFPKDYYPYDPGTLRSVEGVSAHEMVGFNQWDEEWEVGVYCSNSGVKGADANNIRSKNYIKVVPNTNYYIKISAPVLVCGYDSDKNYIKYLKFGGGNPEFNTENAEYITFCTYTGAYGTTYNHDICINLSDPTRNGEYEPYVKHSYPLDSSLTLRGVPKLEDGNLYYDGDTYESDGTVTRKYGVVDLGTLTWSNGGGMKMFFSAGINGEVRKPNSNSVEANWIICQKFMPISYDAISLTTAGRICISSVGSVGINDGNTYNSVDAFKVAMSGVYLVYELATPTTETADPYTNPQEVDPHGTEQYVGSPIPVGHYSEYAPEGGSIRKIKALDEMPLTVTAQGAGIGGITAITIKRAESYYLERPNEDVFNGHKDEVVATKTQLGQAQMSFDVGDLIGSLDDGAAYNIVATVQDGLGQTDDAILPFEVHWTHQAEEPSAEIEIDEENLIALITPIAPENADPEDVADIYRLSADRPELIVEGAEFGETYVDPYPALGDMGGHRIVTRTKNGDYITEENQIAMVDSPELGVNPIENEDLLNIIDFEGRQIQFYWETDYSNTWAKDFQETQYLGGSIEGDWNPAVSRSGTLSSKAITVLDQEMLKDVRRLADYPGICHVRTADGSSYAADVQVSEDYTDDEKGMVTNYSLSITKVDPQGFEGMTKDQWDEENPPEEEEEP